MKRRSFIKGIGTASATLPFAGCSIIPKKTFNGYEPKGEIPRRTLGKTGIKVSTLGFGSHLKKELIADPETRDRIIKLGFEGGINIFDVYEEGFHQFIPMGKSLKGIRKDAVVSLCFELSTDKMQGELDFALKSFETDYIDLYRLYSVDDDRFAIMEKNKKAGKIRAIGVVTHDEPTMMKHIDRYGDSLDYVMIIYNFHHNSGFSSKNYPPNDYSALIPRCEKLNLGILGIKPMGSDAMVALAAKEDFFKDKKASIAQAMLRHVYNTQEIDSTMPAMNNMEEVITNLESAYNPVLSPYEKTLLNNLSEVAASTKRAYLPNHYKWLENWATRTV
ncbi:MAG: aldo/keto reductase [Candidatus Latescibacteria bacterium]|nr:aldo/keto reductase [Candidatus Latescibacterota bacterium]